MGLAKGTSHIPTVVCGFVRATVKVNGKTKNSTRCHSKTHSSIFTEISTCDVGLDDLICHFQLFSGITRENVKGGKGVQPSPPPN